MNIPLLLLLLCAGSDTQTAQPNPSLTNAATVTPVLDRSGRLWLAWVDGQTLYVNFSDDLGASFSKPAAVNPEPENIAARGENRPGLVIAQNGDVLVCYTKRLTKKWSGDLMFSKSIDGGRSFSAPKKINDDKVVTSHAFSIMGQNQAGRIYLAWLDGRDRAAADAAGQPFVGLSLYGAVSTDGGDSFQPNQALAKGTCQCCRLAMRFDEQGRPVIMWRHIFGDHIRDHGIGVWSDSGFEMRRFHRDGWRLEGCPHQGPALVSGPGSSYAAWFTTRDDQAALFLAAVDGQGQPSAPQLVAAGMHPALAAEGEALYLAWMEHVDADVVIRWMHSRDGGANWSTAADLDRTAGKADYPFLLNHKGQVYCLWFAEGKVRLKPLGSAS